MTAASALTFAFTVFVFAAAPGPGVLAIASHGLRHGVAPALRMALGIVTGDTLYLAFALLGLAALAERMGGFFVILRLLGAAYLIYLGVRLWRSLPATERPAPPPAHARSYWSGVLISLGNPKVIFFFLGFLPAFWDLNALGPVDQATVVALSIISTFLALSLYAFSADRLRPLLSAAALRLGNRIVGTLLVLAGAKAAATP